MPDLTGKTVVITGGNSGIGAATVKSLIALKPARLYLTARKPSMADQVLAEAHAEDPSANIEVLQLDLASFESIKKCAAELNQKCDRLDILILNAGVAGVAPQLTKEGYEWHLGVNHLGHALLTQLLMPKMLETQRRHGADVRVIVTTSLMAHNTTPPKGIELNQAHNVNAFGGAMTRYGHSKLANIHFARGLAQHYPDITTVSQHPGIIKTEGYSKGDGVHIPQFLVKLFLLLAASPPEKGALNGVWCATAEHGTNGVVSGKYYEPVGKQVDRSKHATDQDMTARVWDWTTEELAKHGSPGWPDSR